MASANPNLVKNILGVVQTGSQVVATTGNNKAATIGGGVASGLATGAAIGSVFPGAGTVIGGAVGAVVGLVGGLLSTKKKTTDLKDAGLREQVNWVMLHSGESYPTSSSPKIVAGRIVGYEDIYGHKGHLSEKALGYIDNALGKDVNSRIIDELRLSRQGIITKKSDAKIYGETLLAAFDEIERMQQQTQQAQTQTPSQNTTQVQLPKPTNQVDNSATSSQPVTLPDPANSMGLTGEGLPSLGDLVKGGLDGMIETITGSEKGKEVQQTVVKNWFAENWSKITTGALAFGIVVFTLVKSFSKKSKRR